MYRDQGKLRVVDKLPAICRYLGLCFWTMMLPKAANMEQFVTPNTTISGFTSYVYLASGTLRCIVYGVAQPGMLAYA